MVRVGVHVSIAGSIAKAVERAQGIGCDTFQIFSRNPRGWAAKPLAAADADAFRAALAASGMAPAVDHMPYLPNLASSKDEPYERSVLALADELVRAAALGIPFVVTHLGHHLGAGSDAGEARVIAALDRAVGSAPPGVTLLVENTAGEKNSVGSYFAAIGRILEGCACPGRLGVCLDTCHAFGAGYDLRSRDGVEETLAAFDDAIGLSLLRVVHCNDSKGRTRLRPRPARARRARRDRRGGVPPPPPPPRVPDLPFICETPVDGRGDSAGDIAKVRELAA